MGGNPTMRHVRPRSRPATKYVLRNPARSLKRGHASTSPGVVVSVAALLTGLLAASCGTGANQGEGGTDTEVGSIDIGFTSGHEASTVPSHKASVMYGQDFGLQQKPSDLNVHNSTSTAVQLLLSGRLDVVNGSFTSFLSVREKQEDMRAFCPTLMSPTGAIVSTSKDVTSLKDVAKPSTKVVLEGPGGPGNFFMDLAFQANGLEFRTPDFENILILEDNPQRFAAVLERQADVAVVTREQVGQLKQRLGEDAVTVLSGLRGLTGVYLGYFATKEWLDKNLGAAAALCAATLKASRQLAASEDLFAKKVDKYVEADIPDETVRAVWEEVRRAEAWPYNVGFTKEAVSATTDTSFETGLVDEKFKYEEVIDRRPIERALELLGGKVDPQSVLEGKVTGR